MCMCGVLSGFSLNVPSLASTFVISFPLIPCVLVLCVCVPYVGSNIFDV